MILPINPINNVVYNINTNKNAVHIRRNKSSYNFQNVTFPKYFNPDRISFCGKYEDFIREYITHHGDPSKMSQVLISCLGNEHLFVGSGKQKMVYNIPGMDKYVIAHRKHKPIDINAIFQKSEDPYSIGIRYNFGQPIADNMSGTTIMEKIQGINHSTENWLFACDRYLINCELPTESEALQFLKSLRLMAEMPQKAYDHIANEVKYLTDRGISMDLLNPNNILMDTTSGQIYYIDISEGAQDYFRNVVKQKPVNVLTDLIAVMCDSLLNRQYCKTLGGERAEEIEKLTNIVINKCKIAGDKIGLKSDSSITHNNMQIYTDYIKFRHNLPMKITYADAYNEFAQYYKL